MEQTFFPNRARSLSGQFRWKYIPAVFWDAMQSFYTMMMLGFLITMGCLFYLWQWMNYRGIAMDVDQLTKQHTSQLYRIELLEVEIDYLTRPKRLESLASSLMQLQPPEHPPRFVSMNQVREIQE